MQSDQGMKNMKGDRLRGSKILLLGVTGRRKREKKGNL